MKIKTKSVCALFLCLCLCINIVMPALAVNENNSEGIQFTATIDKPFIDKGEAEQTVVVRIDASAPITVDGVGFKVLIPEGFSVTSVTSDDLPYSSGDYNEREFGWQGANVEEVSGVTNIAVITYTVSANVKADEYELGVSAIELTRNYGDIWENAAGATSILTINAPAVVEGYNAGLSRLDEMIRVNNSFNVNVNATHSEDSVFAASEVVVNYDPELLSFSEGASILGNATVDNDTVNGIITIEDYGVDKNLGNGIYVLNFGALKDGTANIEITSAAFVNKENAVRSDLIPATLDESAVMSVVVNKLAYAVELPDIFVGPDFAEEGEDYTFSVADGNNYNYSNITVTVDGEPIPYIDNGDGTYTVENVSGALFISGDRVEKSYSVTFEGEGAEDITGAEGTATYKSDYSFTIPSSDDWVYSVEGIQIGGEAYTGYSIEDGVCTIPGSAISGEIIITVSKILTSAGVVVEGNGAGAAEGYSVSAAIGEDYILTIVPEAGYTYTVSATMNGEEAEVVDNGDNTYTIKNVSGDIVFTVDRSVIVSGVSVSQYLTLDGTFVWLVKNDTTVDDGKVPTFQGNNMYWSEKYNCYTYLVITQVFNAEMAAANVDITDGEAVTVAHSLDVNMSGKVDASDAQLVYNMYNAMYDSFSTNTNEATVEKFLLADTNEDGIVDVQDATVIINDLLS